MMLGGVAMDRELVGDLVDGYGVVSLADVLVDRAPALVSQDPRVGYRGERDRRRSLGCRHLASQLTGACGGCKSHPDWL